MADRSPGPTRRAAATVGRGVRRVFHADGADRSGLSQLSYVTVANFACDAILAVALGGTSLAGGRFYLIGTLIGALIIQTLTYAIYSLGVPPEINMVVKAIVVFGVCLIQSPALRDLLVKHAFSKGGAA